MATPKYSFKATDATRESVLLRLALCGPTGSGKTKTGLIIGTRLVEVLKTGPLFVIDSESRSSMRYAFSPRSQQGYRFKHVPMPDDDFSPDAYTAALDFCESEGAGVVLIDSLSHVWNGINGVLEQVDRKTADSRSKNAFGEGWREMTPIYNRLVQRLISTGCHVIFTLRAKVAYEIQKNERGKNEPVKIGMAPLMREGFDYEVDLWGDMTVPDNALVVSKTRIDRIAMGEVIRKPTSDFADVVIEWMKDCEPTTGARTLGEALSVAVAEGLSAAEAKDTAAYKDARAKLYDWCDEHGVDADRRDAVLAQFKDRVTATTGGKASAPQPKQPASDEEQASAIDQGRA